MKTKLKTSLVAGFASLLMLFPTITNSTLSDVAKPYLGIYECKSATLGSKDILDKFEVLELELKEEHFVVYYKEKRGGKKKMEGEYRYDKEREVVTLTDKKGGMKREFPLKDGNLTVVLPIGKKALTLQFEQK